MIIRENIDIVNKIIRDELIKQSQLKPERIKNAISLYGADLSNNFAELQSTTIKHNENLLLFELYDSNEDLNNLFEDENNSSINCTRNLIVHVMIYGNGSQFLATKIIARMLTAQSKINLYKQGVDILKITPPTTNNEFINNSMWIRTDFEIKILTQYNIEKVEIDCDYEDISAIEIIKE